MQDEERPEDVKRYLEDKKHARRAAIMRRVVWDLNEEHRERSNSRGDLAAGWDVASPWGAAIDDDRMAIRFFGVEVWQIESDEDVKLVVEDLLDELREYAADLAGMVGVWADKREV